MGYLYLSIYLSIFLSISNNRKQPDAKSLDVPSFKKKKIYFIFINLIQFLSFQAPQCSANHSNQSINQKKNNEFSNKFARFERATNWKHTQMLGKELDGNNSQSMQIQTEIQNDFQTLIPM